MKECLVWLLAIPSSEALPAHNRVPAKVEPPNVHPVAVPSQNTTHYH